VKIEKLSDNIDAGHYLKLLGADSAGVKILSSKMKLHFFLISDMHVGAANILKQDALSIGADLAVPKGTVTASQSRVDAILIANERQLAELCRKELSQPLGLKEIAAELKKFVGLSMPESVRIMGVINANDDSFYTQSRFSGDEALSAIADMIGDGADIIDIGAVSSRPGSSPVDTAEEMRRIKPLIDALYAQKFYEKAEFSIDSYRYDVVSYALERGFSIVNDITGLADDEVCRAAALNGASAVIMHMQGAPQNMQHKPHYESVVSDVSIFFEERLEKAERFGIKDTILDVGIGFGKNLEHNLTLIAHLQHFLKFGRPLLVGASRKSMIDKIIKAPVEDRLGGTLAIHLKAAENGAGILRVHDVKEHVQALRVARAIQKV